MSRGSGGVCCARFVVVVVVVVVVAAWAGVGFVVVSVIFGGTWNGPGADVEAREHAFVSDCCLGIGIGVGAGSDVGAGAGVGFGFGFDVVEGGGSRFGAAALRSGVGFC